MQEWAQWWLVSTRPSGETKLAEQPWASRADDSRTWSSHFWSTLTPYFCLTLSAGKLLNVHMPSSARAAPGEPAMRRERHQQRPEQQIFLH